MLSRFGRVAALWMPATLGSLLRPHVRVDVSPVSADAQRWRRKATRYAQTVARMQGAVERAESRYHALHTRFEARRHSGLDHDVLRQVLPIRASHVPLSIPERREATVRDAHLQARSDAYRDAICGGEAAADVRRIDVDGLPWWVPIDSSGDRRLERLSRQGFPYRAILQTREVAIGGFMLDIGANLGRTAIPRIMLGDVRVVYAAEPEPANYACLVRNVVEHNLRGMVLPDRVAIGAVRGEARMHRSRYPGGHRVLHGDEASRDSIIVAVWPLDEWVVQLGIDVDALTFVKVDAQGSELEVLRGARALLARRHVAWQIEVDPGLLRRRCAKVTELLELLAVHFSHFIDIGSPEPGVRVRPTADIAAAVSYLGTGQSKTDLLLYHAAS